MKNNPSPTTMKECNHEYEDGSVMAVGTCKMCGKYVDVLVDGQPSEENAVNRKNSGVKHGVRK